MVHSVAGRSERRRPFPYPPPRLDAAFRAFVFARDRQSAPGRSKGGHDANEDATRRTAVPPARWPANIGHPHLLPRLPKSHPRRANLPAALPRTRQREEALADTATLPKPADPTASSARFPRVRARSRSEEQARTAKRGRRTEPSKAHPKTVAAAEIRAKKEWLPVARRKERKGRRRPNQSAQLPQ